VNPWVTSPRSPSSLTVRDHAARSVGGFEIGSGASCDIVTVPPRIIGVLARFAVAFRMAMKMMLNHQSAVAERTVRHPGAGHITSFMPEGSFHPARHGSHGSNATIAATDVDGRQVQWSRS